MFYAVMDSRIMFVFGLDRLFCMCVCVIRSSLQAVLLWFRMQRMCPITGLTDGPVGTMKARFAQITGPVKLLAGTLSENAHIHIHDTHKYIML